MYKVEGTAGIDCIELHFSSAAAVKRLLHLFPGTLNRVLESDADSPNRRRHLYFVLVFGINTVKAIGANKAMKNPETIINKFTAGVEQLEAALEGLSEADLDLVRAECTWSIRQIVHHIADSEEIWKIAIKAALGNSGCTYDINWYEDDNLCAEPLDYANRPITTALASFRLSRLEITELVRHFSDALDLHVYFYKKSMEEPRRFDVVAMIRFQTIHFERHLKQINETRSVHGC